MKRFRNIKIVCCETHCAPDAQQRGHWPDNANRARATLMDVVENPVALTD
ncbi:MAG: hypothetical protein HKN02_14955 [Rhodobacteraceae bacterium]|nr:hypothetical protein [Paracoccaceae bacterium]